MQETTAENIRLAIFYKAEGSDWRVALQAGASRGSPLLLGGLNGEAVYELASASFRLEGERPLVRSPLSTQQRSPPPTAPRVSVALPEPEPSERLDRSSTPHSTSEVTVSATAAALSRTSATSSARSSARTSAAVRVSATPLAAVLAAGAPTASATSAAKQTPLSALQELISRGISGEQLFYLALGSVLSIGAFLLLLLALLCCVLHRNSSRRRQLKRLKRRLSSNSIATTQAAAAVPLLRHYKTLSPSHRPNGITYAKSSLNCRNM